MLRNNSDENIIRAIVGSAIEGFAIGFRGRHEGEVDDPDGTINMKIHNVFIEALGEEIQYYTALVRSLDSSLGNMLEKMAIKLAEQSYEVRSNVQGPLSVNQTRQIAELLENYKSRKKKPSTSDYNVLRETGESVGDTTIIRHDSDYYLIDRNNNNHFLIELKIGGDLDNKKARSEKEAILEQYAILSNTLDQSNTITIYFATAYNRFGEGKPWKQERVRQFFADDELLIGKDFWDFICRSDKGYDIVLDEYRKNAYLITDTLDSIKRTYLEK